MTEFAGEGATYWVCDNCGRKTEFVEWPKYGDEAISQWHHVALGLGRHPDLDEELYHFCTEKCLDEWFGKAHVRDEEGWLK